MTLPCIKFEKTQIARRNNEDPGGRVRSRRDVGLRRGGVGREKERERRRKRAKDEGGGEKLKMRSR